MTPIEQSHLDLLLDFQHNSYPERFQAAFGPLADHMIDKFIACESNLLKFYSRLDDRNAQRLLDYLNRQNRPPEHSVIADLPERHEMEQYGI